MLWVVNGAMAVCWLGCGWLVIHGVKRKSKWHVLAGIAGALVTLAVWAFVLTEYC